MEDKNKQKDEGPGEALELAKLYPPSKYNLLLPTRTIQEQLSPLHKPKLEIVQLTEAEIYEVSPGSGAYAVHKNGLQKFGAAVGINWPGDKNRLISDDGTRVVFQATGECRRNDGTWQEYSRTYCLDLQQIEDETRKKYTDKAQKALSGAKKGDQDRLPTGLTEDTRETWIEKQTARDVAQKRKFRVQLSESGAMNRVILDILTMKGGYKKDQILKPFVLPRIIFSPDFAANPEARQILISEAVKAGGALYGGRTETHRALPVSSAITVPAEATQPGENGDGNGAPPADAGEAKPAPAPAPAQAPAQAPAPAKETAPAPDPEPDPKPAEPTLEERFPKMNAKDQADAIRKLVKEVDWMKPFKPDIEKWKPEHRTEFFGVLMDLKKKRDEKPY